VCEVDPLDLIETVRGGLPDPGPTVRAAHRCFGDTLTVTRKDIARDKEGQQ
jgi:hypothetical protein